MSYCQDPPRKTPKAFLLLTFFKILPNFNLVREFWNETARVPPVITTFLTNLANPNLTCNINMLKNIFENSNSLGGEKHLLGLIKFSTKTTAKACP